MVYFTGAGTGNLEIDIVDPKGNHDTTKPRIARSTETTYYVEYLPKDVGRYLVHIFFAGKEIPASPYPVNVGARKLIDLPGTCGVTIYSFCFASHTKTVKYLYINTHCGFA